MSKRRHQAERVGVAMEGTAVELCRNPAEGEPPALLRRSPMTALYSLNLYPTPRTFRMWQGLEGTGSTLRRRL